MKIIEVDGRDLEYLIAVATNALSYGQTLKVAVDGGVKVKRGESVWTPPLGHPVDGNGERV